MTTFIDNSTLSSFARCPSQAILRYHLGYTTEEESHALRCGTAVHAALECFFRGGTATQALEIFGDNYEEFSERNIAVNTRLAYHNIEAILDQWLATHALATLPYKVHPEFVEVGFNQPLYGDVFLVGRLDALVSSWDEQWWYALDHKTTKRIDPYWVRGFQLSSQLSGYIWAAGQEMGNVVGAYVNGIETSKLPSDPKRKCREHGVKYAECGRYHMNAELFVTQRTPEELEEWRTSAISLASQWVELTQKIRDVKDLHEARMYGMFTGACTYCESYNFCLAGRAPQLVNTMFVHNPWTPHEGMRGEA